MNVKVERGYRLQADRWVVSFLVFSNGGSVEALEIPSMAECAFFPSHLATQEEKRGGLAGTLSGWGGLAGR